MTRLKHLLRLQYGSALKSEDRAEGEIQVFGSSGPVGFHDTGNMLSPAIVVGRKGSHGKVTWAENGGFCIDTALFVDRRTADVNLRYAYYLLQTLRLDEASRDSAVPGLDRFEAHNKPVPCIREEDQHRIADFLDRETARIDQLIEKKQRLVELLEEKRNATVKQMVFGQYYSSEFAHNSVSWMPSLPDYWSVQPVKRYFKNLDSRRIPVSSEIRADCEKIYPYYGASGIIDYVDDYIFDEDLILVGEDGANLIMQSTPIAFVARGRYWVNNHAHIMKPLQGPLEFWVYALNQIPFEIYVTGSAQPKLTAEDLGNIPIPVPPVQEQHCLTQDIEAETSATLRVMEPLSRSIQLLREFRSALITAAVTGEIDVDEWQSRETTDRRLEEIEEEMRV